MRILIQFILVISIINTRKFRFSIRELAGGIGDFGTFLPFIAGYIALSEFEPSGILVVFGIIHIVLALVYNLPLPVQPMKVIGSLVLAEQWSKNKVFGAGFSLGIVLIALSFSNRINKILESIPLVVIKGIQLSIIVKLLQVGGIMISSNSILSIILLMSAVLLFQSTILPSSLFLVIFGVFFSVYSGNLDLNDLNIGFSQISLQFFDFQDILNGFISGGLAQLPLTISNAVVATVSLIRDLFPDRKNVTTKKLLTNMGVINLVSPFFGGIPICHGAGGLSAHFSFGARTGGAILLLGILELGLGLFFSSSLFIIFSAFPLFVLGVMLTISSLSLIKSALNVNNGKEAAVVISTAFVSLLVNLSFGLLAGILLNYAMKERQTNKKYNW
jgi:hypothetical protein